MTAKELINLDLQLSHVSAAITDALARGHQHLPRRVYESLEEADYGLQMARLEVCSKLTADDWAGEAGAALKKVHPHAAGGQNRDGAGGHSSN